MFLDNTTLLFIEPCGAESGYIKIKVKFSSDISSIMPYLNAVIHFRSYNTNVPSFIFKKDNRLISIYSTHMTISKIINETDAYSIMDFVKDLINETYDDRNNIEPNYEMKKMALPFEIYSYLPQKNCKKCNETTCIAFASKLLNETKILSDCMFLRDEQYKEKLKSLTELLGLIE